MSATCRTHIQAGMPSGNSLHSIASLVPPQQPPFFFAAKLLNTYIIKQKKILFGIALTSWVVKCLVFLKSINVPSCVACRALSIHPQFACRCKHHHHFYFTTPVACRPPPQKKSSSIRDLLHTLRQVSAAAASAGSSCKPRVTAAAAPNRHRLRRYSQRQVVAASYVTYSIRYSLHTTT